MNTDDLRPVSILMFGGLFSLLAYYFLIDNVTHYVQLLALFANYIMTALTVPAQFYIHMDQLFLLLEKPAKLAPIKIDGLEFIYTAQASSAGLLATAIAGLRSKIIAILCSTLVLFSFHFLALLFAAIAFVHHYLLLFSTASIIGKMFFQFYIHATPALLIMTWLLLSNKFFVKYLMELVVAQDKIRHSHNLTGP
jgi:hypothetical protein